MPLDIAVGLLLALGIHTCFSVPFSPELALFGIASTLLPDIDILTALFGKWRHRAITHYPLLYVPVVCAGFLFAPLPYAALFAAGILAHFIHDTIGTGWGISWLWPLSTRRFLILPDGERRKQMGTFATWLPEEKPEWAHHGEHTWVRNTYFRLSPVALVEYGVLGIALLTLTLYLW